jgi:hypothetical protein
MVDHSMFRAPGVVSAFFGHIRSERKLGRYLETDFREEFGFTIDPSDAPEFTSQAKPVELAVLLEGFSWSAQFADAVVTRAAEEGWKTAECAVVFYNFRYQPAQTAPTRNRQLTFIGTFEYGEAD